MNAVAGDPRCMLVPHYVTGLDSNTSLADHVFHALIVHEDLSYVATSQWVVGALKSLVVGTDVRQVLDVDGRSVVVRLGGALVRLRLRGTSLTVRVAAATRDEAIEAKAEVQRRFPEVEHRERDCAQVTFWNWAGHSARDRPQTIDTPPWASIAANYPASVAGELDALMSRTSPPDGGRLILWHGPPGSGKTHLIRALLHAWKDWCVGDYVVDVDALLSGNSEYLTGLILDGQEDLDDGGWRLVVLEDAGEFLMADAARTQGQGFSRLLNTLDGMLGQSARLLVLVTTNRPLTTLDAAITRPGRCAMALEVPAFSAGEATAWLDRRGHPSRIDAEATLAELYGVLRGDKPPAQRRPLGFAA